MKKAAKKKAPAKAKAKRVPEPDVNQLAHHLVKKTTESAGMEDSQPVFFPPTQADISRVMAELGRRGGRIGGKARAAKMTKERRVEIALKAARKRWDRD